MEPISTFWWLTNQRQVAYKPTTSGLQTHEHPGFVPVLESCHDEIFCRKKLAKLLQNDFQNYFRMIFKIVFQNVLALKIIFSNDFQKDVLALKYSLCLFLINSCFKLSFNY